MSRDKRRQQVRRGNPELPHPKCVYCGIRDGIEREHVIASCFFNKPFPPDLPKLPACADCNRKRGDGAQRNMSDDEAYVRDRICMQLGIDQHPDAKALLERKVLRNLSRPESHKQREDITASMEPVTVELEPDIYLTGGYSFKINLAIFERVMGKMVRGLYAYHMGERMPDDYGVVVVPRQDEEMFEHARKWISANDPSPLYVLGANETVCYQYAAKKPNRLGNNWLFTFYSRFSFYVHAGPRRDIPPEPAELKPASRQFPVNTIFRFR